MSYFYAIVVYMCASSSCKGWQKLSIPHVEAHAKGKQKFVARINIAVAQTDPI